MSFPELRSLSLYFPFFSVADIFLLTETAYLFEAKKYVYLAYEFPIFQLVMRLAMKRMKRTVLA